MILLMILEGERLIGIIKCFVGDGSIDFFLRFSQGFTHILIYSGSVIDLTIKGNEVSKLNHSINSFNSKHFKFIQPESCLCFIYRSFLSVNMPDFEHSENIARVKEVMGNTYEDKVILKALTINQNNFERALNYLLEGHLNSQSDDPATDQLRQSLTDAFTNTPHPSSTNTRLSGTGEIGWGESDWSKNPLSAQNSISPPHYGWANPSSENPSSENISLDPVDDSREPLVLPTSPPKGSYQPVTVTGQTTPTEDFSASDQPYSIQANRQTPAITARTTAAPPRLEKLHLASPDLRAIEDNPDKRYEAELNAAIEASLAPDSGLPKSSQPAVASDACPLKDLSTEDEQMSKALEESLAMSGSKTLETEGRFLHPPAYNRRRSPGTPTALRVHNPHLVFLPCVLSAMYAAKPFRDRILAFQPPPELVNPELVQHDIQGLWNGKSSWRAGENWPEKPLAIEIILAIQRLFAAMSHTTRSYLDVHELSLLLGYEEGEMISWSLNEPNKGCHRTYEVIAEAWRELSLTMLKQKYPQGDDEKMMEEYDVARRLFHWRGHKLPLPLPEEEASHDFLSTLTDNSTTSLTLNTRGSTLNDIYTCIDAQVWLPESNLAHFLDGISQVLAFEIDRKSSNSHLAWSTVSTSAYHIPDQKTPFKLEPEFWVDRYLLQKRHKIFELREEISRIEGEADVSLARRDQLSQAGGKDLLSTLKAAVEYLSTATQFPTTTSSEREQKKKEVLPKFQEALSRLETELLSLDHKAKMALAAAKAVFDIDEMKEVGPHDLCAVVVSDGFSGREHMWTYIKADDGKWFKSLDQTLVEVSPETVLSDPAGLHMNSGHIFAIYVRRPFVEEPAVDSLNIRLTPHLEKAIIEDNEHFAAEVLESKTMPQASYVRVEPDVVMSSDSPRSDVAEVGIEVDSPLRLTGGAKLDIDEESVEELDSDQEESSEDEDEKFAELGFLQEITQPLNIKTMTGKVGGRPIWLNPFLPLSTPFITCCSCGFPMAFLMQMNAPEDSNPDAYFRTIYIFVCRKFSCLKLHGPGALKAFRVQYPETYEPPWQNINTQLDNELSFLPTYREWEIICEEEPFDINIAKSPELISMKKLDSTSLQDEDAKTKGTKVHVDEAFLTFQSRIARAPDQILRYLRVSTPSIEPLWVNEPPQETKAFQKLLRCGNCGKQRTAEFQILSTILLSLGIQDEGEKTDELDFGTLIIYTCPASCSKTINSISSIDNEDIRPSQNQPWFQEFCWIQMFSNHSVFNNV
ncbi:hypothetical protein O181_026811 [Austropuccinia psidii MF-1]|uniref:UBA domain-containing protein n=1 Tax=Austropuccinia psidii MF-1 TaxID=1389203 RepID=A0A9Q3CL46_9BASI|nr:hypothetical protein [Austropuccinia psidii MF-1]